MKKAKIKSRLTTFIFSFQFFISLCLCVSAVNFYFTNRAQAQTGGTFTITKSVIAGGGGQATGGIFSLDGTIGQSLAGTTSAGGTFELGSGFWGGGSAPAADVTVSGRVLTPDGRSLRNAVVSLIDSLGVRRTATTSSFGLYSFASVRAGDTYIITVASKRYRFTPRIMPINSSIANLDFFGLE